MNALPVLRFGDLTIPPAKSINNAASPSRGVAAAAERSVIPLVYGEDRIKGLIVNVLPAGASSPTLLVQVLWCYAGDSVNDVRLNDKTLSVGTTLTHYTGAQTTPDAALVAAFAAQSITYADTLNGLMYSVLAMPTSEFDGQLEVSARIRGRRLYDVRKDSTAGGGGAHRIATPSTWEWSDNPALAEADFIRDTTYGLARAVDQSTVGAVANACDALIGSPSEKRRIIGVTFSTPASASDIAEALRAYAGCFLIPGANGIKLVADSAGSSVATYSHADGTLAAIGDLQRSDIGNIPTAVEVSYTDTSAIPWRDATAVASLAGAGTTRPWRLSQVRLPGIKRYSQAFREAKERLDKLSGFDLSCTIEVFDIGIRHEEGDIITVTHPIGLSAMTMRVAAPEMIANGKWRLRCVQYSGSAYSTATPTAPAYGSPGLTNPVGPPANVASLAGAAGDGVITWTWAGITDRNYAETQLRLGGSDWATATPLWSGRGTGFVHQITSPGTYTVRARHMLDDGQLSVAATSASATVSVVSGYVPDTTPPPAPTGLAAVSLFRGILIEWTAPTYTVGNGNDVTEVYVATYGGSGGLPTIPATPVGVVSGKTNYFVHDAAMGSQLHVWIRYRTRDNVQGPAAGGTNGLQVTVGRVGNSDLGDLIVTADKLAAASVTNAKMAANAIGLPNFAAGIEPVTIVSGSTVPTTKSTETIYLAGQSKIFRWNGTAYVATVPSTDISGQLSDSQIAAIAAAKLTGQITGTQITDGAISTPKLSAGSVTTAVLAADAVTADKIAANAVTAAEIAAGAITTAKLAAGAVTANEIAANAITAGKVAAGAIGADQILANAIVAGKIAAGAIAVGSAAIADGAIRNALIENLAVDNAKIASLDAAKINTGFLAAARIQAGTIDATKINSNGLTIRDSAGNLLFDVNGPRNATYGTNLLYNGDFSADMDQWFWGANGAVTETSRGFDLSGFALIPVGARGNRALWSAQVGTVSAGSQAISYQWHSPPVVATGGERIVGSVYVGAHRCAVECFLFAYNTADELILVLPTGTNNRRESTEGGGGGGNLSNWKRIYTGDTAPAGTAYVRLVLRKYNTVNLQADSYMFATRCMVEKVAPLAPIVPTPWAPPSDMSRITAANASTFIADLAVNTLQIANNAVTVPIAAVLATSTTFGPGVSTVLSAGTIDTGNRPITVTIDADVQWTGTVRLRVQLGATDIFNQWIGFLGNGSRRINPTIHVPTPGAGALALSMIVEVPGGGSAVFTALAGSFASNGTSLVALGTKK
jgi:hypothetical protein